MLSTPALPASNVPWATVVAPDVRVGAGDRLQQRAGAGLAQFTRPGQRSRQLERRCVVDVQCAARAFQRDVLAEREAGRWC